MLGLHGAAAALAAWAAAEVLMLRGPGTARASPTGWGGSLDGFGARYGEGHGGYAESFNKGFGDGFGHGVHGDGFDGYRLGRYGEGYGYGGNYGYDGNYKGWLDDWPTFFFEGFPSRKNSAPAKFSTGDSNFDFLGGPKYNFGFGASDYLAGDKLGPNEFSNGEKVVGMYTLKGPGGHVRTVKYFADDSGGFQASVVNSDGDFNGAAHGFGYGPSDGDFNGAAYGLGYGYGPSNGDFNGAAHGFGLGAGADDGGSATIAESLKSALGAGDVPTPWSGWAGGGGGGGGDVGGVSWHGLWAAYGAGAGPLAGGYAVHEQPQEDYA